MTLENNRAPLLYHIKLCASFQSHRLSQIWVAVRKPSIQVKKWRFFVPRDLEISWMTLKNNRAPPLYYIKLCASFQIHLWFQTGVTVRKRPILVKISNFLSRVTLKFDGWRWKTIGQFSYAASRFVHHFIAINGEFKLELQSGNSRFGSKSSTFVRCDLVIWQMTLKNNRAPFLSNIKLCALFITICKFKLELQSRNG